MLSALLFNVNVMPPSFIKNLHPTLAKIFNPLEISLKTFSGLFGMPIVDNFDLNIFDTFPDISLRNGVYGALINTWITILGSDSYLFDSATRPQGSNELQL